MRRILLPLILLIFCVQTKAQSDRFQAKVPPDVRKFVLKDYEVCDYKEGDLNGDRRKDAILILRNKKQGEWDSTNNEYLDFPIPFLVLIRNQQNRLVLKTRSDSVLTDLNDFKQYEGITINSIYKKFTIDLFGGRRFKWSRSLTFQYKEKDREFHLIDDNYGGVDSSNPEEKNDENYHAKEEELVGITVSNFNYDDDYLQTESEVIVDKTYFYSNPDLKSKHRKGYLQKGDIVYINKETTNFALVLFFGKNNTSTSGFILKNDLKLFHKYKNAN